MKTPIYTKAIPSILFIAGSINKATFSALEIFKAIKQFQHGDVVPVLDTLSILTNGKFSPLRNKEGAKNLRASIEPLTVGAKSQFKKLGAVLALLDLTENEATEENGFLFCELAKQHSDDLKQAYEATKPTATTATTATTESESVIDANSASNPVDGIMSPSLDQTVDQLFDLTINALHGGLFSTEQLAELRMLLAELSTVETKQLTTQH